MPYFDIFMRCGNGYIGVGITEAMKIDLEHSPHWETGSLAPIVRALVHRAFGDRRALLSQVHIVITRDNAQLASRHSVRCSVRVRPAGSGAVNAEATDFTSTLAAYHALGKARTLLLHRDEGKDRLSPAGR